MSEVVIKAYETLPTADRREVLRYCKAGREADSQLSELIDSCIEETEGKLSFRVVSREYPIFRDAGMFDLGFVRLSSHDLGTALFGCDRIIVFAATVGFGADRLIGRYSRVSPARALVLDAVCTERIETLCNSFEADVTEGAFSRPRYSPGYGDVPITVQKDIFRALTPEKYIGLTLNESMLMSPTKSVSAFIGIRR